MRSLAKVACRLLVALACASGCRGDVAMDGGSDASLEADGAPPADAARDTPDAPRDVRDVGVDGGADDPDWAAIAGYPLDCDLRYARHPERLFTPEWVPCGPSGPPGCTWLPPDDRFGDRIFGAETARFHDGSDGYFRVVLVSGPADALAYAFVVARSIGPPVVALASALGDTGTIFCGLNGPGLTGAGISFLAWNHPDGAPYAEVLFHAPLDGWLLPPAGLPVAATLLPGGSSDQHHVASESTAAFVVQPVGHVVIEEGGRMVVRGGPAGIVTGSPTSLRLEGRDAFWMSWNEGSGNEVWLVHATIDEPETSLVRVPDTKLWGLAVDQEHICWVVETTRTADGRPDRGDLYCSPYATTAAGIAPSLVHAGIRTRPVGTLGAGLYAQVADDPDTGEAALELFDVTTGGHRTFALPAEWGFSDDPLWVTADEIALPLRAPHDTVVRVALDAFVDAP